MPSEDEIRDYQEKHSLSQNMKDLLASVIVSKPKGRCEICGLDLIPGMNCPRCLNIIQ